MPRIFLNSHDAVIYSHTFLSVYTCTHNSHKHKRSIIRTQVCNHTCSKQVNKSEIRYNVENNWISTRFYSVAISDRKICGIWLNELTCME